MAADVSIGIDLGTTNSVVSVFRNGQAEILPNRLGDQLTPSAVGFDPKGDGLLVGRPAKELLALGVGRAAAFFKRDMGQDTKWKLGAESYGALELSALVLRSLAEDASAALGQVVTRCVITVPAYFDEEQRNATIKAGELAGLQVDRILNEPTAAAIAYGLHRADTEMQFMVVDLGGGTLDVSIMELFDGILQVKSTAGESWLGGEDFSRILLEHALAELGIPSKVLVEIDQGLEMRLLRRAELAKRELTRANEVKLKVLAIPGYTETELELTLDRQSVDRAWGPLLERIKAPIRTALRGAGLEPSELDQVILVGGATRMLQVRQLVRDLTGKEPLDALDADLAIAQGAAIQAALCLRDEAVEDIVVTDVLSHTLGVDVVRTVGGELRAGYFSPLLHRNSTIPNSTTESYGTTIDYQTKMRLDIYEGESRRVEANRLIGTIDIKGIPRGRAGQEVEVTLTIDVNGVLEIRALIAETGHVFSRVFHRQSKTLSEAKMAGIQRRLDRIKVDPRTHPVNRELLLRAERLWQEMPSEIAERIAEAMDGFEAAILSRHPESVLDARTQIRRLCDEIEGNETW